MNCPGLTYVLICISDHDDKLYGECIANDGEMLEKEIEEALREIYGKATGGILVIKNLKMQKLDAKKSESEQELDFIIVNFNSQTIINIEAKTVLGQSQSKKAEKQLLAIKNLIANWFKDAMKGKKWKVISVLACKTLDQGIVDCSKSAFVGVGKDDFIQKMKKINAQAKEASVELEKFPEDFVNICKYLLYCSPVVALPIGGNLTKAIQAAIEKSGSKENIYIWCYPTPQQRGLLECSKIVFASPYGSGKTMFQIVKAIELSDKGEKVLFLLFIDARKVPTKAKPLLAYDLEDKFKNHPLIKVEVVFFEDSDIFATNFEHINTEGIKHIMVDEFFSDFAFLSAPCKKEFYDLIKDKETVWISPSNYYNPAVRFPAKDLSEMETVLKEWFPGFEVVKMTKPLRMPLIVAKDLKDKASNRNQVSQLSFNKKLLEGATLPSNLAEGLMKEIGCDEMQLLPEVLQEAFQIVKGEDALIILNDDPNQSVNKVMRKRIKCKCRNKIVILTVDVSLQANGRKETNYATVTYETRKQNKAWIEALKRRGDMVSSYELARGFEHYMIIDIVSLFGAKSRSMAHVITTCSNPVLDMEWIIQNILTPNHNCDEIMNWDKREKVPSFSMSAFICKSLLDYCHFLCFYIFIELDFIKKCVEN